MIYLILLIQVSFENLAESMDKALTSDSVASFALVAVCVVAIGLLLLALR